MYLVYDNIYNYDDEYYDNNLSYLNENDKNRINKLINNNDKKLYIISRILLINILKDKYLIDYKELIIRYNKYNKPYIDNLYYNISHSHEYAVVVSSNKEIGVDIEKVRDVDINIINYFCTDNEKKYILESTNKYKSLFEIFCLKEAYFKMIGSGIGDFKDIDFFINDGRIECNKNNLKIIIDYSIDNYIIAIIEKL